MTSSSGGSYTIDPSNLLYVVSKYVKSSKAVAQVVRVVNSPHHVCPGSLCDDLFNIDSTLIQPFSTKDTVMSGNTGAKNMKKEPLDFGGMDPKLMKV